VDASTTVIKDIAEVHNDILMYEYKHGDVIDVADFEEIAPKMGTVIRKVMILPLSLGSAFSTPQWSRQNVRGVFVAMPRVAPRLVDTFVEL
jgi:hypothetical protein